MNSPAVTYFNVKLTALPVFPALPALHELVSTDAHVVELRKGPIQSFST